MRFKVMSRAARSPPTHACDLDRVVPNLRGREFEALRVDRDKGIIFDDFQRRFALRQLMALDDDAKALMAEMVLARRDGD